MRSKKFSGILPAAALLCLAALFAFVGCGGANAAGNDGLYTTIAQLDGKRVAVGTGTVWGDVVKEVLPSAEIVYLDGAANVVTSILEGKADAFAADEPIIAAIVAGDDRLTYIQEHLNRYENAFFVSKDGNAALLDELNGFIRRLRDDGTLVELQKMWFETDESKKPLAPYETFPAPNGTLRLAQDAEEPPFVYMRDGRIVGYDIDILARFCEARGYGLKPVTMNFSGLIPAVQSGKCDLGGGAVTITKERAESVTFTEPIFSGGGVLMVRAGKSESASGQYASLKELNGKRIGVQTGVDELFTVVRQLFPDSQIYPFKTFADLAAALEADKIDAFPGDDAVIRMMMAEDPKLAMMDEPIMETYGLSFGFQKSEKGEKLRDEMDDWLRSVEENGELERIQKKWIEGEESAKTLPDYASFPAPNGVLTMATEGEYAPFNYYRGNELVGLELDLAARFCQDRGYGLDVSAMAYEGVLPALVSGKYDFAGAALLATEEHEESACFSRPYYFAKSVMAVRKGSVPSQTQGGRFVDSLKASFGRTFIREGRWRLFLDGVGVTLVITALSVLFGTALGFAVYLLCRNGNPVANAVTRFCVWLVRGMPMVVLLMILYYIVFGGLDIDGLWVAVIAFTLTF
ncbi:MAG: ABC transporter permease subunit, partial [Synergistaceae bacterium]|nr:ABC transporter permease subunit [Synergistaceae bacterium]